MHDAELLKSLQSMGLDETSYRALLLLPLVRVAWADGTIQQQERDLIRQVVADKYPLSDNGQRVLDGWLAHQPTPAYFDSGFRLLSVLSTRVLGMSLADEKLDEWMALGEAVARAHGGFLGLFAINADERRALEDISHKLDLSWAEDYDKVLTTLSLMVDGRPLASPDVTAGVLVYADPSGREVRRAVDAKGVTIGRHGDNDVVVRGDAGISRYHCRIFERDGTFWLEDVDSARGTLVNGERVRERRLFGGETIEIAELTLRFVTEVTNQG